MEVLISEVQKRNVLWNKSHCRHKDQIFVDNEWDEVAKCVGISKNDAKKRWWILCDQFDKELKKIPKSKSGDSQDHAAQYSGKWLYFTSLLFLMDTTTPRDTAGNLSLGLDDLTTPTETDNDESNSETSDSEVSFNERCTSSKHSPPCQKRKEGNHVDLRVLKIEEKQLAFLEGLVDENSLFLMSLIPFMRKLDPIEQLRVRTKFQNILLHEMERKEIEARNLDSFSFLKYILHTSFSSEM